MVGIYLEFNRKCGEALRVYEEAFGVKAADAQKYGDLPEDKAFSMNEMDKDLILYSRLVLGGVDIMLSDTVENVGAGGPVSVSVTLDRDRFQKAWDVLEKGGEVTRHPSATFFAETHGSLRDRFGVNWMFTVMK